MRPLTTRGSIHSISVDDRIKIAHNSMGSRVFDALLNSPTVPTKMKRQFVMDFIGNYHTLVDDKLGSRVGDRCWAFCDTYLKVSSSSPEVQKRQPNLDLTTGKNSPIAHRSGTISCWLFLRQILCAKPEFISSSTTSGRLEESAVGAKTDARTPTKTANPTTAGIQATRNTPHRRTKTEASSRGRDRCSIQ